jgi:hypothetical protein
MKNCKYIWLMLLLASLLMGCNRTKHSAASSHFEYCEVYLPDLPSGDHVPVKLNSIDHDWGIWGHNLSVVLPEKPSSNVYAKSGNGVNRDQFCFTSDALYKYIKKFICDNYGSGKSMRFAILPNDNSVVCQCNRCIECGNTKNDASGAIYYMLERLTKQFPEHFFFTSYYRTACSFPTQPLPENAGVLISAIHFPLSTCYTSGEDDFVRLLGQWSVYTKRIYVWDYINNFDDYFTPFPIFDIFQHRLRLYAQAGVKGVFLNGSGADYSTFYRLKIHILALLLSNPDVEWRPLLRDFCRERYPVTGDVIYDFVVKQEDTVSVLRETLSLYEGVSTAVKTYLPVEEFIKFHNKLLALRSETKGIERKRIEKISRATMLTHLELKRMAADTIGCKQMLEELEKLTDIGIIAYSESGGTLDSYVDDYRYMLRRAEETWGKNLLKGVRLEPLTELDEDYNDISILTDGLLGLPSCYHCGQMLSSATPALRIAIPHVQGMKHLRVNMTKNSIFHISLPLRVSLTLDGHEIGSIVPTPSSSHLQRAVAEFDVPCNCKGKLVLNVYRDQEDRTMALDEIEGF